MRPTGRKAIDRGGQYLFKIGPTGVLQISADLVIIQQRQHRKPDDHGIPDGQQDDGNKPAHLAGFLRAAGAQHLLHIVIGRRSRQTGKQSL